MIKALCHRIDDPKEVMAWVQDDLGKVIARPLAGDAHHGGFRTVALLPTMEGLVPPKHQEKSNDLQKHNRNFE
jgi:hypothetical protein